MTAAEEVHVALVEPIVTVSAVEAVIARLRDRVLDGGLAPGEHITEGRVAADYRVSRPTAKSAISALVVESLLRRDANKPAYVPQLTADDVHDLFLVRTPLEVEVVRRIASVNERPLAIPPGAAEAVRDVGALADAPRSRFVEADLRFHRLLVESVSSPRLSRLYRRIVGEVHLTMVQSQEVLGAERIAREHGNILKALEDRDRDTAERVMRRHLEDACNDISKSLRS